MSRKQKLCDFFEITQTDSKERVLRKIMTERVCLSSKCILRQQRCRCRRSTVSTLYDNNSNPRHHHLYGPRNVCTTDSSSHHALTVMFLFSLLVVLFHYNSYQNTTTTTVVAFGYYYHPSRMISKSSSSSSSNNRCVHTDPYLQQSLFRRRRRCQRRTNNMSASIIMGMIHINDNSLDNNNIESSSSSSQHHRADRKLIPKKMIQESLPPTRKKGFFFQTTATSGIRLSKTKLHMLSKCQMDASSVSSVSPSSLMISSMTTGTSSSSTTAAAISASTAPIIEAPSTTIQQQISDHVVQVTTDLEVGSRTESVETDVVEQNNNVRLQTSSSVHLQLTDPTLLVRNKSATETDEDTNNNNERTTTTTTSKSTTFGTTNVIVHTYNNTTTNQTWKALNIPRRKFRSYLQYCQVWNYSSVVDTRIDHNNSEICHNNSMDDYTGIETVHHTILSTTSKLKPTTTTPLDENNGTSPVDEGNEAHVLQNKEQLRNVTSQLRDEWRTLWKVGRLVTDRTELLAVYPSDIKPEMISNDVGLEIASDDKKQALATTNDDQERQQSKWMRKRGGFADLLFLYTDRLMAILSDEHDDNITNTSSSGTQSIDIVQWLDRNYGKSETYDLRYENFQTFDEATKLMKLKHFLEWFRSQFPYFYDRCDTCGASIKEDLAIMAVSVTDENMSDDETTMNEDVDVNHSIDDSKKTVDDEGVVVDDADGNEQSNMTESDDEDDSEHQTFVGYVYPNGTELIGKASRTELYQCHQCSSFTRFPRYNAAQFVMSQQRGRCGEYSMLLYRFIRALHHECRWVVDWADHVWVELLLQSSDHNATSRWIHLDPCEAAVDENFIYQGWGKKQNYIVGFYLPTILNMEASLKDLSSYKEQMMTNSTLRTSANISYIEDVTRYYTNEEWSDVCQRRDESESHIHASIIKAAHDLQHKLLEYYNYTTPSNATATR